MHNQEHPRFFFLTGFMASGKSTLGHLAVHGTEIRFLDLDQLLEKETQLAVSEIFSQRGEEFFREIEAQCLRKLTMLPEPQYVIACGGGTPHFHDNLQWMKKNGVVIFIDPPIDIIINRLDESRSGRPLAAHFDDKSWKKELIQLWEERRARYLEADIVLDDADPENILNSLQGIIQERGITNKEI